MRKRIVFWVLVFLWMGVIFFYSHRPAEVSAQDSYEVGMMTGHIVVEDFEEWSFVDQLAFAMKVDHPIRKLAHFTEYLILAVLLCGAVYGGRTEESAGTVYGGKDEVSAGAVNGGKPRPWLRWLLPWLIATLYAVSDEVHQYFIPGRSCQVGDVMIDSAGACVGVLVVMGIVHLLGRKRAC
ncbi:MAG: VanZ family protein [Lachnospiraceae bacterium]|nr:VanZ family protein [Lachnospiraceae bacterium]